MTQFYRPLHQLYAVDPQDPYDVTFEDSFRQTDYEYDNLHRLRVRSISSTEATWQNPVAVIRSLAYTYDENSNRRTMTDDEGDVTTYVHDAANRVTQVKVHGAAVVTCEEAGKRTRSGRRGECHIVILKRPARFDGPKTRDGRELQECAARHPRTIEQCGDKITWTQAAARLF